MAVLDLFFPWLYPSVLLAGPQRAFDLSRAYQQKLQGGRETRDSLLPHLKDVLLQANQCDEEVYSILLERFEQQLTAI